MSSQQPQTPWSRYAGMGFEFAASMVVCTLLGYWVDYHWQIQSHWGLLIGLFIGLIGGTYNFIREAMAALREVNRQAQKREALRPGGPSPKGDSQAQNRPGDEQAD